jgi:hypothetical protein
VIERRQVLVGVDQQDEPSAAGRPADRAVPCRDIQPLCQRLQHVRRCRFQVATVEVGDGRAGTGGDGREGVKQARFADAARSMEVKHRKRRIDGVGQGGPEKLDLRRPTHKVSATIIGQHITERPDGATVHARHTPTVMPINRIQQGVPRLRPAPPGRSRRNTTRTNPP